MLDLLQSLDAYDWAKAFAARHPIVNSGDGRCEDVEELMLGWFANAIMRGWDGHAQRYPDLTEKVAAGEARAAALQQEVAAYKSAYAFVVAEEHQREIELDAAEAAIVSLQAERDALFRDVDSLMNAVLTTDAKLERLQAQLQAITQEMRQQADELFEREEMARWMLVGHEEGMTRRAIADRLETLTKSQNG